MPHTSAVYQLWHLELSLTLLSPSFLAFEAEEYNNYRSQAFSPCCSRGNNTLLLCLHPTPHPHLSLLVTFLEFCNPSLSSLPLEILLSSFWQKLLLPVCDTLTHFMQLYYNRTGRWNWKLTHFWRTCCVPGTVQRIFTRSQLILKTTFKGGDDISITQVRKEPLAVKVIELGIKELTQEPISDDSGVCILYAK